MPVFSVSFSVLYLICGISDMLDGSIARKTNSVTKFGEKLDSVADFLFLTVSCIKIVPVMNISSWLWWWVLSIAGIRLANILLGMTLKKQLFMEHTFLNKITGLLLFLLPLTLSVIQLDYSAIVVCAVATIAALQESVIHWSK